MKLILGTRSGDSELTFFEGCQSQRPNNSFVVAGAWKNYLLEPQLKFESGENIHPCVSFSSVLFDLKSWDQVKSRSDFSDA